MQRTFLLRSTTLISASQFNKQVSRISMFQLSLFSIWNPKSRGYDAQDKVKDIREKREREKIREKWGELLVADPYYSPVLLAQEPTHASILKRDCDN